MYIYIDDLTYTRGKKTYRRVLLREGYRKGGKVKHRTLANLSHCSDEEIEAIRIALKMKSNVIELKKLAVGGKRFINVPRAGTECQKLLDRVNVTLPKSLPYREVKVATRKQLQNYRKFK